jgi:hypothetical protein
VDVDKLTSSDTRALFQDAGAAGQGNMSVGDEVGDAHGRIRDCV